MFINRSKAFARSLVAFATIGFFSPAPLCAETPNAVSSPAPASVKTVGTFRVERYGAGAPALLFIPGLASGSWVWDGAVKRFAATHALYVVTLAGFDGVPAPAVPSLDSADASLLALVTSEKLDRPVVIGHSLGGFLALRFGIEHSPLVRGIVSVDGTPVFPTLAQATPDQRAAMARTIAAQMSSASPTDFAASEKQTIATMVTDPANADRVAALSATSDPKAVAAYAGDLFSADLRPQLSQLTAPVLELAPVPTTPAPYEGLQASTATMAARQASYKQFYTALFPATPNLTVTTIPNSRHFIMVDQPQALFDAIAAFIDKLPK